MQWSKITFVDGTIPLKEKTVTIPLVIDTTTDVNFIQGTKLEDFVGTPPNGIAVTSEAYKLLEEIYKQNQQYVCLWGAPSADLATKLPLIVNNNFFFALADTRDSAIMTTISGIISSANKHFLAMFPIANPGATPPTTDADTITAAKEWIANNQSEKITVFMHRGTLDTTPLPYNLHAGWVGQYAVNNVGTVTCAHQVINGCPINYYEPADQTQIESGKNMNWIQDMAGVNITKNGNTTSGTFIDVHQSKFWLQDKVDIAYAQLIVGGKKVPFTLDGKGLIFNTLTSVMNQAGNDGIVDPSSTVITVPNPLDVPTNDRANRNWTGIKIDCRLTGSAHSFETTIYVNV